MNNFIRLMTMMLAISIMVGCAEAQKPETETVISQGLQYNESTFAYDGGLLIANFGSSELNPLNNEGKGYIAMLKDDLVSVFIPADGNLSAPKGMLLKDDYLLVCDVNKLVAYKLDDPSREAQVLTMPSGELFVNDIVTDGNDIYISVTNSGNIFKIDGSDLSKLSSAEPEIWCNVVGANGLVINDDVMYVASYPADGATTEANVIYAISDLSNPVATKLTTRVGQWDGLALSDDNSTLYASSWSPVELVSIDLKSGMITELEIDTEFVGAADFTLSDGKLYIPDLPNSKLIIKNIY